MKEKKKNYIELMMELVDIYKDYIKKHSGSMLSVLVKDNSIKMNLIDDGANVDEFGIVFDNNERHIYITICFVLVRLLFYGRKKIFDNNIRMISDNDGLVSMSFDDDELFQTMWDMINLYDEDDFYDRVDKDKKVRNKLNRRCHVKSLRERIFITKRMVGDK